VIFFVIFTKVYTVVKLVKLVNILTRESFSPYIHWVCICCFFFVDRNLEEDYPADSEPTIHLVQDIKMAEKAVPINDICFSGLEILL